ncbi:hypothetical protein H6787_00660 [Candidatus Nomurabacteria bacterium]|nr:hypothetical protein [Candidatus Nomurabacteria bacterium]
MLRKLSSYLIQTVFLSLVVAIVFVFQVASANAAPVTGYAWSSNIGWICFDCGTANVQIDGLGFFSGYAWSSNIGWIDFGPSSGYPSAPSTRAQLSGGTVIGWARALSYGDGWDGWIKMSGSWANGVTHSGTSFNGYAWGDDVVGWVDFSGVSYVPPVAGFSCTGSIPAFASAYDAEESTGLGANTSWTQSGSDTAVKCQYTCNAGYSWDGSSCQVSAGFSCTGSIPAFASAYDAEESTGLGANTPWTQSSSDTAVKCQYTCNAGYSWDSVASSCQVAAVTADIIIDTIECDSETDLPNWNGNNVNVNSANNFLAQPGKGAVCRRTDGWSYEWHSGAVGAGGYYGGVGSAGAGWTSTLPTGSISLGRTKLSLTPADLLPDPDIGIRQIHKTGYLPFGPYSSDNNVSAEFWCYNDANKYDNYEGFTAFNSSQVSVGNTYYCVAFNVRSVVPQADLISKNITLSAGPYTSGTAISLSAGVENDSTVAVSDGFSDNFSYSWTSATGPWTDIVPFVSHGTGISAGATLPDSGSFTPNQSGTLYIQHCVDSNREIDEGPNENPNCSVHSGVAVGSAPLDLEPVNPSIQSQTDNGDGTYDLSIRVGIRNLGPGTLPALSNIPYRTNILLGGGGTIVGPTDNFNGSISPVSSAGPFFHTLNNIPFGSHQVCSRVNLDPVRFTETPPANNASNQNCQPLTLDVPPPNVLEITSDKEFIRAGETATIIWDILAPYAMTCTVKGPGGVNEGPFNVSANVLTHSDTPTTALNSTGEYKLNCAETTTGTVFTDVTVVEIIPDYEER